MRALKQYDNLRQEWCWMTDIKPEKYASKEWVVFSDRLGKFSKKEAQSICNWLKEFYAANIY